MSEQLKRLHEQWLGMVQPVEGLVVSVPVLVDAGVGRPDADPATLQQRLLALAPPTREGPAGPEGHRVADLDAFLGELLELTPDLGDRGDALPRDLSLYVPEGGQTIRPTLGLRCLDDPADAAADESAPGDVSAGTPDAADQTPASRAGAGYLALVWDLADPDTGTRPVVAGTHGRTADTPAGEAGLGLPLDKPESLTGSWEYPPAAKFDRLLRHCRVPVGLLTNRETVRLVYAPHGESSGHIDFPVEAMAQVGGRPILDAFVSLLSAPRLHDAPDQALPALLAESRKRQANVTSDLADQVFDALQILLAGFEAAAERDGWDLLGDALARDDDHLYRGLLTVLMRLVFLLYAEDRGLLPTDQPLYAEHLSVLGLFEQLRDDAGAHPDAMGRRFGAWARLLSLFRAVYLGVDDGAGLHMPPRRGALFDPHAYPFLEGWGPAGSAPITQPDAQGAVRVPTVDDGTIHRVLEKLLVFEGQRLSYRTLDVEQIGSVYEALMGYHVARVPGPAVRIRGAGVWLTPAEVLDVPPGQRPKWIKERTGLPKAQATKLAAAVKDAAPDEPAVIEALATVAFGRTKEKKAQARAPAGRLVLQPGSERRRTSSHYTPRSLTEPIVRRTIEPLLACMGDAPASDRILELKICDPAMGSGAFLVEACRFLADQLVAAWTREGQLERVAKDAPGEDPTLHARRLVAQKCLYGVDKNEPAVELAKLSLWLVTLAKDLPFTFLDHALRHGDSLVGLDFDQIRAFHWSPDGKSSGKTSKRKKPPKQLPLPLIGDQLDQALDEAIALRQQVLDLAANPDPQAQRDKERLVDDADDALRRIRLVADLIVGAFFAEPKDKAREKELARRRSLVETWLASDQPIPDQLAALQADLRARTPAFHWMLELPEVFHAKRPDPLDAMAENGAAFMDGFVGNPPFAGKNGITETNGDGYLDWLKIIHEGAHGNADLSAHFFRRAATLVGDHGTIGLIATNTIAQGDTRSTGLQHLVVHESFDLYAATRSMPWPGAEAAVTVAVAHLARGNPTRYLPQRILDGQPAPAVNSRLRAKPERPDPQKLPENAGLSFQGSIVLGMGFVLTPEERAELIAKNPKNAERIFPYLGGEEVNTSPTQSPHRFVISFGQMSLEEAEQWPDLLNIVRERVKPERDRNRREVRRKYLLNPALFPAVVLGVIPGGA